ncbi:MAG TPA: ATP synthase F1 subunit epsilon [Candidatus Saccharimonadia bacterium]
MKVELLTLSGVKFSGEADELRVTTTNGQIGILPHHEPFVAQVVAGSVVIKPVSGQEQLFATYGGLLEVSKEHVRLLADEADHADDLLADEIEEALARAKELRDKAKDRVELEKAQGMIDRANVRLGVARMRRHHRER